MDENMNRGDGMEQSGRNATPRDLNQTTQAIADEARAKLHDVAEPLKDKAQQIASDQKDAGADHIQVFARAVHGAAHELESEMPQIAGYVHDAGGKLESFASDLRHRDLGDVLDELSDLARERPAMVLGGAMIAGFALSRFLKSSADSGQMRGGRRYGNGNA